MSRAHMRFFARTIIVENKNVDAAYNNLEKYVIVTI